MYAALAANTYVGGGDISITRIIAPPRIVVLRKYNEDAIVEDASARIWSLLGSSVHRILELAGEGDKSIVVEKRLMMPIQGISLPDGPWVWKVTGQPDVYEKKPKVISDYKVTSVWAVLFGDKPEWEKQVNLQAMLHRHKGDKVDSAYIVVILRDWQTRKAKFEKEYPPLAVQRIGIPLWTQEEAIDYAQRRVRLHQTAQMKYLDSEKDEQALPPCTPDERWYRGHSFAVKFMDKAGKVNKNAKRKFDNKTDAVQYMKDYAPSLPKGKTFAPIEERPGQNIRCESYCDVWQFCGFGRKVHEAMDAAANIQANLVNEKQDEMDLEE